MVVQERLQRVEASIPLQARVIVRVCLDIAHQAHDVTVTWLALVFQGRRRRRTRRTRRRETKMTGEEKEWEEEEEEEEDTDGEEGGVEGGGEWTKVVRLALCIHAQNAGATEAMGLVEQL
ncbi:unnamed protein product [Prorocentrum cordatum]|uniref:Uncharacterized protein n=1 Tax=Prorocentrum cordatum TaxID=2364126 RepID=A0ABN9W5E8_9DINO|nr:unnamed protein product [Polarella glacialis]